MKNEVFVNRLLLGNNLGIMTAKWITEGLYVRVLFLIVTLFTATTASALDWDPFGFKKEKQAIEEQDARVKAEIAQWDQICKVCQSTVEASLPSGIRVLDWKGMCAPSKTSTGHSTTVTAIVSGGARVFGNCYTDQRYKVIDFSLTR